MAMEEAAKAAITMAMLGLSESAPDAHLVSDVYLPLAASAIMAARHPFSADPDAEVWEARYDRLQCEVAADMFMRRGAEGETAHSENGVSRTWASAGISRHLMQRVVPLAKVPGA